jgi:hypothetical protein
MPSKKAKSAFMAALSYACRLWASRLRFWYHPAPAARGSRHKISHPKRQKAPFRVAYLMLVASGRAASAFGIIQLQRLEARDISHDIQKGKKRLYGCPVLCLSPLGEPPPLLVYQANSVASFFTSAMIFSHEVRRCLGNSSPSPYSTPCG